MTDFKEQAWLEEHFRQSLSELGGHIVQVKRLVKDVLLPHFARDGVSPEFIEPLELIVDELGRIQREVSTTAVREGLDEATFNSVYQRQHAAWSHEFAEIMAIVTDVTQQQQPLRLDVAEGINQLERLFQAKNNMLKAHLLHEVLTQRFGAPLNYRVWINSGLETETLAELERAAHQATTLAEFEALLDDIDIKRRKK